MLKPTPQQGAGGKELDWTNISFLALTLIIGIGGTALHASFYGVTIWDIFNFVLLYVLSGMGITAGYHRYFSHRSYHCHAIVRFFYLVCGAAAFQHSALRWCSNHRNHHKFVDTERDPYNALRGFFYAHMGWMFYKDEPNFENVPDLLKDPIVAWQHRYCYLIAVAVGMAFPLALGFAAGRPLAGLLWGGFLRIVVVHQMTFLINSAAHYFGRRPYTLQDSSRDNWWLAFFSYGEGYHNFHHCFQGDYRNGWRWYHWDPTKWLIRGLNFLKLTWNLNKTPEQTILEARLETDVALVKSRLSFASEQLKIKFEERLKVARQTLESAHEHWFAAQRHYKAVKQNAMHQSQEALQRVSENIETGKRNFKAALLEWRRLVNAASSGAAF